MRSCRPMASGNEPPAGARGARGAAPGAIERPRVAPGGPRARKTTLRDVAAAAEVSIGTASNAFNRPELLSPAMRERVLAEAGRLGYSGPDPVARRLRTGRA